MMAWRGFQYLATAYSKAPNGIEIAFRDACRWAAKFIDTGVPVFSPIAHSHMIAIYGNLDPLDHRIWLPVDRPMMEAATGLIVVTSDGWQTSIGIAYEIEQFRKMNKPVLYWIPGDSIWELTEFPNDH